MVLTFTEIVNDPRVLRHVIALRESFDVTTCGQGPAPDGVTKHYQIPAVPHLPTKPMGLVSLGLRFMKTAYRQLPAANEVRARISDDRFDVIIANDITSVPVAYEVAAGRPVLADLHEFAPRQFEGDWRWRLMVQPFNEYLCREFLPKVAAVTTVCDGIANEYRRQYGVTPATITNATDYRAPRPRSVGPTIRAVHSGAAQPNRELELMIRAAAEVDGLTLDVFLVSSATNRSYFESLRNLANGTGNVRVLSPVPMAELPETLDAYDLGIFVLPPNSFNAMHTLPNKFFDYVQSGLGVLIGPSPEMAALARRHNLGKILPDFTEESVRGALRTLQPDVVARWKAASCAAAQELSSQEQAQRLREIVGSLSRRQRPTG